MTELNEVYGKINVNHTIRLVFKQTKCVTFVITAYPI